MSVGFEALPRQTDSAKWFVLLPCVFVPVYLWAPSCCVCTYVCISTSVCSPLSSLFRRMHTLADYGSVHACVKWIQSLVKSKIKIKIKRGAHFFSPLGREVKNRREKMEHLLSHKWIFSIG